MKLLILNRFEMIEADFKHMKHGFYSLRALFHALILHLTQCDISDGIAGVLLAIS